MGPGTFYLAHTPTPISAELVLVFSCVAVIAGLIGSELNWVCPNVQSQPFSADSAGLLFACPLLEEFLYF